MDDRMIRANSGVVEPNKIKIRLDLHSPSVEEYPEISTIMLDKRKSKQGSFFTGI
jgi:hypothetical protein